MLLTSFFHEKDQKKRQLQTLTISGYFNQTSERNNYMKENCFII